MQVAGNLTRGGMAGEPAGDGRNTRDPFDGYGVEGEADDVGSGHGGARDGVGGRVAGVPGREHTGARGEDVELRAPVGEGRDGPGTVDGADGDGAGGRGGRVGADVSTGVTSSNDRQNTRARGRGNGRVEGSRVGATEGHVDGRLGGSALGDDVVGGPVEALEDDGRGRRAALEDLDG